MTPVNAYTCQDMEDAFFAARIAFGPLTPLEECQRKVAQLGFRNLIQCDAVMCGAELTDAGRRWLLPVIRQALDYQQSLPISATEWIELYHRARHCSIKHFADWNTYRKAVAA